MGGMSGARFIGVVLSAALAGCAMWQSSANPPPPPPAGPPATQAAANDLQTKVDSLTAQVDELKARNQRLSEQVTGLNTTNDQLMRQLQAVGDAPRQRDTYKQWWEQEQRRAQLLLKQIDELRAQLHLPPTTRPALAPTTAPVGFTREPK
jgi:outer membrane murein-binding lipoprotein Lpp